MMPKQNSKLEAVRLFFWDARTKKCMGRTGESWLKIIAFYIALYAILAAVWTLFFIMFQQTISDRAPKWILDQSLIGKNPGLGFRPRNPPSRIDSALISFKAGPDGDYGHWIDDLSTYIERNTRKNGSFVENCNDKRDDESYCPFDTSVIPPECSAARNFSFDIGKPCILVKVNRIYDWKPKPYDERPADYPKGAQFEAGSIPITCDGQNDFDKEHIGPIAYHPQSIDKKYYPFRNQPGYQSPFVMVHFKEPKYNTLIYVECRAWASNIEYDRPNKKGITTFELYIEKPGT